MLIRPTKLFNRFDAIIFDDYYTAEELDLICKEIQFIEPKLGDENKTNAATEQGPYGTRRKKRGRGVFLDEVYTDRRFSNILSVSRKLFFDQDIRNAIFTIGKDNIYWRQWQHINHDSTLLQTYQNGDFYDYHIDNSQFTSITTLKWNSMSKGGNLWFREGSDEIEFKAAHNTMILFPSIIEHRVQEIIYENHSNNIFDFVQDC